MRVEGEESGRWDIRDEDRQAHGQTGRHLHNVHKNTPRTHAHIYAGRQAGNQVQEQAGMQEAHK